MVAFLIVVLLSIESAGAHRQDISLSSTSAEAEGDALVSEGNRLLFARQPAAALKALDRAIGGFEKRYSVPGARGRSPVYSARSEAEAAIYRREAASRNSHALVTIAGPSWSYAYFLKAFALVELDRAQEAPATLDKALTLAPHNSLFLSERATAFARQKNWRDALRTFEFAAVAARDLSPPEVRTEELGVAWRGLGYVYVELGRLAEAEVLYVKCVELNAADQEAARELVYVRELRASHRRP